MTGKMRKPECTLAIIPVSSCHCRNPVLSLPLAVQYPDK